MPSQDKLIKNGIKYTDALFDEIIHRLEQGVIASDTLEAFLEQTKDLTTSNPLVTSGYDNTMLSLILAETNNHKFSRPAQKELVRVTIENKVGDLIRNVGDDIVTNVRDIVKYGYNNNLSQDEIAKEISSKVTSIKNKRARAIARTEIARTATLSDYVISAERGATHFYVECRNTACPICKEAWHEGWTVENDDSYTPSDTSAGGKGWIGNKTYNMSQTDKLPPIHPNCRCVPYFYKDKKEEPVETKTTEPVTETVEPKTTEDLPKNIETKMDKFGNRYSNTKSEHLQFITEDDTSKVVGGMEETIRISGEQTRWLNEKKNTGKKVYGIHNHPESKVYTLLSDSDVDTFVSFNKSRDHVGLDFAGFAAENKNNRCTIKKLDNFDEKYNQTSGQETSKAINRAYALQKDFYDVYHPTVSYGRKYLRQKQKELTEQGLKGLELMEEMEKYEAKSKQIDQAVLEERNREYFRLVEEMNKDLNQVGLHIEVKIKDESLLKDLDKPPKLKVDYDKYHVSEDETSKPESSPKGLSQHEQEQLDFLEDQVEIAESNLKKMSKDNPQYDSIKKMVANNKKKIDELKSKI